MKHNELTRADFPEATPGYSANGESLFTRVSARMKKKLKDAPARSKSIRTLIEKHERLLRELYAEHRTLTESDARIVVVRRNINAKQNFVAKLWAELAADIKRGRA